MFGLRAKKAAADEGGFNLVDMLISVAIFVIVLGGLTFFFTTGLFNTKRTRVRETLNQQASGLLEQMIREIRVANRFTVPTLTGDMTGNPIYFRGDVRGDGVNRNITFYRTTADRLMTREQVGAGSPSDTELAEGATALEFAYYDKNGASLGNQITSANRTLIKKVTIRLVLERPAGSGDQPVVVEKSGSVVVRSKLTG